MLRKPKRKDQTQTMDQCMKFKRAPLSGDILFLLVSLPTWYRQARYSFHPFRLGANALLVLYFHYVAF